MNSINTTILSNTFDKKDLLQLFDKEIDNTMISLEYYGPIFDINNINNDTMQLMNILDGFNVDN